ncbi:hypothetical protein F5Y12DRAFT_715305 [Xylaria sp. FL1777]|nr:hypothetical protein F5Y12DRAFT_715305 [Xylaria sp. FL1777]
MAIDGAPINPSSSTHRSSSTAATNGCFIGKAAKPLKHAYFFSVAMVSSPLAAAVAPGTRDDKSLQCDKTWIFMRPAFIAWMRDPAALIPVILESHLGGDVLRVSPNRLIYNDAQAFKDLPGRSDVLRVIGFTGNNVSTVYDPAEHRRKRRILAPGFSNSVLAKPPPL